MKKLLLSFFMCMLAVVSMQADSYVKVTTEPSDWSGEYLIVCEASNVAFNGGLETLDAVSNNIAVTINNDEIESNQTTNAAKFTIAKDGSNYTIKSASGYYVGQTSDANGLKSHKSTTYSNTLSINNDGSVDVKSGGAYLRYNSNSNNWRFRYFKSSTYTIQKAIALYKLTTGEGGGDEPIIEKLAAPTFSPEGGAVEAGTLVAISATNDATIMYKVGDGVYAEYSAPIEVTEECTITAYATKDGFEPSAEATATYTIKEPAMPIAEKWTLVEDASTLTVGGYVIIVAADSDYALSTNQKSSNRGAVAVTKNGNLLNITADVQVLTLEAGINASTWAFNTGSGYLYAASSTSNHLKTKNAKDVHGSWAITIDGGVASIVATGSSNRNVMQYNPNDDSPLFACYSSASQKSISLYRPAFEENIAYGMYYLCPGAWDKPDTWYAAKFVNANTGAINWVYGLRKENEGNVGVYYGLEDRENAYTHIMFCAMGGVAPEFNEETGELVDVEATKAKMTWENVVAYSEYLTYTPAKNPADYRIYFADSADWQDVNPGIATGVNRVEMAGGIGYAYGVVSAEGAIEVYNVNGAVVARGNDTIDLRGLGRGVYIIRNGNQVRKVVR